MKISLGYANRDAELEVMARQDGRDPHLRAEPVLDQHSMAALIQRVRTVNVAVPLRSTSPTSSNAAGGRELPRHQHPWHAHPAARSRAPTLAEGRNFITLTTSRRCTKRCSSTAAAVTPEAELDGITEADVLDEIVDSPPVPRSRQTT